MQIPTHLTTLYRHWERHTQDHMRRAGIASSTGINDELLRDVVDFAAERMRVWEKKTNDQEPPFTTDPILQRYRFCNIYRELDRQTIQIHEALAHLREDFDLWLLNLAFNRFLCNPDTFAKVGFINFDHKNNSAVMQRLLDMPSPKYGSAYVFPISVIQRSEFPTREQFFCYYLPVVVPKVTSEIKKMHDVAVSDALETILPAFGFNFKFHWTEILIDIAYQFPDRLNLLKRFPLGPGSLPTIKRLANLDPETTLLNLVGLKLPNFPYLEYEGKPVYLSAENWEGIGCEFRKYSNLRQSKGRRRIFKT